MKLTGKQIMIIDDDDVLRTLLERVLEAAGCTVVSCPSIKVALEKLNQLVPDLVILDLNMPELHGLTFLKFRHLNSNLASIPVIVLSGTKNKEMAHKALAMGAEQFLEKPFEARVILQKLRYIFFSQEKFIHRFEEADRPMVEAEVGGDIVELSINDGLKVESQARLGPGKAVQLLAGEYLKGGGAPLVCKIAPQLAQFREGLFRMVIHPTGLDSSDKKRLEDWMRSLIHRAKDPTKE